jgi:hypothetical protein
VQWFQFFDRNLYHSPLLGVLHEFVEVLEVAPLLIEGGQTNVLLAEFVKNLRTGLLKNAIDEKVITYGL